MARPAEFDREQALQQAQILFERQGYRATTINDLVQVTDMQPGSIYAAFKNKENIFLLVLNRYVQDLVEYLNTLFSQSESPIEAIERYLNQMADKVDDKSWDGCLLVNSMVEFRHIDGEISNRVRRFYLDLEQLFAKHLRLAQRRGLLAAEHDADQIAAFLLTCWSGINATRGARLGTEKLQAIVRLLRATLFNSALEEATLA